jgi:hypothetical protein
MMSALLLWELVLVMIFGHADNDPDKTLFLTSFMRRTDFRKGVVRFQLPELEVGVHTLTIKAWDVMNNSSEIMVEFRVVEPERLVLDHVLNYPNPFTTRTNFWFEHNRPNEELRIFIQVYTVSGKLVKTLRETIFPPETVPMRWNGMAKMRWK